jgi:carbamoyl-phosphate synthase large subunit
MRDASFAVIRAIGVETGAIEHPLAMHLRTGRMVVIEMNLRLTQLGARFQSH